MKGFQEEVASFLRGLEKVSSVVISIMHIPSNKFSSQGLFRKPSLPHMQKCLHTLLNEVQILKSTPYGSSLHVCQWDFSLLNTFLVVLFEVPSESPSSYLAGSLS